MLMMSIRRGLTFLLLVGVDLGPPVAGLLHVLLQLHVDLHVVRVLLLEHLDLPPQVSQVLQLLLVRLDGRLVLANLG